MSKRDTNKSCSKPKQKNRSITQMSTNEYQSTGKKKMHATAIQADEFATGDEPQLSREIQDRIGNQLRLLYDQVVDEDIPKSLLDLLKRLEARK